MTHKDTVLPAALVAATLMLVALGGLNASEVNAQEVSPATTTLDSRIVLIGETNSSVRDVIKNNLDVDEFFRILESNTQSCSDDCEAIYVFKNTLGKDLPISRKGIRFYNRGRSAQLPAGTVNLTSVEFFNISSRSKLQGLSEFQADTRVAVRIRGVKAPEVETDWVPYLCIDGSDFPAIAYGVDEVCMYQSEWAIWGIVSTQAEGGSGVLTSPVAYYDFDLGGFPDDNAIDQSGNGNDGNVTGAINGSGIRNNGIKFQVLDNDVVNISDDMISNKTFSYGAWINASDNGTSQFIIDMRGDIKSFVQLLSTGKIRFYTEDSGGANSLDSDIALIEGRWYHFFVTYDGAEKKIYINGVRDSNISETEPNADVRTFNYIGNSYALNEGFNGSIDEVRIFNFTLTPKQVLGLYTLNDVDTGFSVYSPQNETYQNASAVPTNISLNVGVPAILNVTYIEADGMEENVSFFGNDHLLNLDFEEYAEGESINSSIYTGQYHLNGNAGDGAGKNDGTASGGAYADGYYGQGYDFRDDGDEIEICDEPTCTFSKTMCHQGCSFCFWANPRASLTGMGALNRFDSTGDNRFIYFDYDDGNENFDFHVYQDGTTDDAVANPAPGTSPIGLWSHVCGTYDGGVGVEGNAYIYVNGTLIKTSVDTVNINSAAWADDEDFYIGAYDDGLRKSFNGTIDEVQIWANRTLTANEVKQVFDGQRVVDHSNYENTVALWNGTNTNISGKYGDGMHLQGDGYLRTINGVSTGNAALSISLWAKTEKKNQFGRLLSKSEGAGSSDVDFSLTVANISGVDRLQYNRGNGSAGAAAGWLNAFFEVPSGGFIDAFADGEWHHILISDNGWGSTGDIVRAYFDGVEMTSTNENNESGATPIDRGLPIFIGSRNVTLDQNYNGSVDDIKIITRKLSEAEAKAIYRTELRWKNDTYWVLDGDLDVNVSGEVDNGETLNFTWTSCNTAGFCQSEQSLTIIQSQVLKVVFDAQVPSDIGVTTLYQGLVNITYNISSAFDITSNTTWSSVNTTYKDGCYQNVNGSCERRGNVSNAYEVYGGVSDGITFLYRFGENAIYPLTENIEHEIMEDTDHTETITIDGTQEMVKIRLFDVQNDKQQGEFEVMVYPEVPASSSPLQVYYCNSSYTTGKVRTSNFCTQFGLITLDNYYNHSHSIYQNHSVISFPVNTGTGELNGIPVTNESYFVLAATGSDGWIIYGVPLQTRADQCSYSTGGGSSWTSNIGITWDAHLHQFDGSEAFCYFGGAIDSDGKSINETERCDLLDLAGLPPSAPNIFVPTDANYGWDDPAFDINHSIATSPNAYPISYYNRSLFDESFSFIMVLNDTTTETEVNYDVSRSLLGSYHVGVRATDDQDQTGPWGFSDLFNITSCVPLEGLDWYVNRSEPCKVIDQSATVQTVYFIGVGDKIMEGINIVLDGTVDFYNVSFGGSTFDWSEAVP